MTEFDSFMKFDQEFDATNNIPSHISAAQKAASIAREFGLTDYEKELFIFWL